MVEASKHNSIFSGKLRLANEPIGQPEQCSVHQIGKRYGSDVPAHSWATRVGAVTAYAASQLVTTPTTSTYSAGFVHGPFSTSTFTFDLKNTGQTAVNWSLAGIPYWLTAVETGGRIAPGDAQSISLQLAPVVNTLPEGDYSSYVSFNNCTGPGSASVFFDVRKGRI